MKACKKRKRKERKNKTTIPARWSGGDTEVTYIRVTMFRQIGVTQKTCATGLRSSELLATWHVFPTGKESCETRPDKIHALGREERDGTDRQGTEKSQ